MIDDDFLTAFTGALTGINDPVPDIMPLLWDEPDMHSVERPHQPLATQADTDFSEAPENVLDTFARQQTKEQMQMTSQGVDPWAIAGSQPKFEDWMDAYDNGQIPTSALAPIEGGVHHLRKDAASAYKAMQRAARKDGVDFAISDSYRSFEAQVAVAEEKGLYSKGGLAAEPGTSNHGWGLALDINVDNPRHLAWLRNNASRYGFETIAREPWHWEFSGKFDVPVDGFGNSTRKRGRGRRTKENLEDVAVDLVTASSPLSAGTVFGMAVMGMEDDPQPVRRRTAGRQPANNPKVLQQLPAQLRRHFKVAAQKTGVPLKLLIAVAAVESGGGDPSAITMDAISSAGAIGATQLMPGTAEGLGVNPHKPGQNILGGATYIAQQLNNFKGDWRKALGAYNAGPGRYQVGIDNGYAARVLEVYRSL